MVTEAATLDRVASGAVQRKVRAAVEGKGVDVDYAADEHVRGALEDMDAHRVEQFRAERAAELTADLEAGQAPYAEAVRAARAAVEGERKVLGKLAASVDMHAALTAYTARLREM